MIARLVRDCSLDIENLERVECQPTVMPFGICQTGDRIEDGLLDVPARTDCHYDVLMLMMFRHRLLLARLGGPTPHQCCIP